MNHRNTLHTCCPCCGVAFELTTDNIRQQDFKRKFKKYDHLTKSGLTNALDADSLADDQGEDQEDEDLETEL